MIKRFAIMKKTKPETARPTRLYTGLKRIRDIMERFPKKAAKWGDPNEVEIREYKLELRKVHSLIPTTEPEVVETPTEVVPPVVETPVEVTPPVVETPAEVVPLIAVPTEVVPPVTAVDVPAEVPPPVV